ncbi:unnamed protein product [Colias eurytheme]|nr:unnamed protein product [Colias eurytheme]
MLLPDQTYEVAAPAAPAAPPTSASLAVLLRAHRVRPDFFCAYRSRRHSKRSSRMVEEEKEKTASEPRPQRRARTRFGAYQCTLR